jgi:hypothetical protein
MRANTLRIVLAIAALSAVAASEEGTTAPQNARSLSGKETALTSSISSGKLDEIKKAVKDVEDNTPVLVGQAETLTVEMIKAIGEVKAAVLNNHDEELEKKTLLHVYASEPVKEKIETAKIEALLSVSGTKADEVDKQGNTALNLAFETLDAKYLTAEFFKAMKKDCAKVAAVKNGAGLYPVHTLYLKHKAGAAKIFGLWSEACPEMKIDFKVKGLNMKDVMESVKQGIYKDDMAEKEMSVAEVATAAGDADMSAAIAKHDKSSTWATYKWYALYCGLPAVLVIVLGGGLYAAYASGVFSSKQEL